MESLHLEFVARVLQVNDDVNNGTALDDDSTRNIGPLTGIIISVFFGVTVVLVLIEMSHILDGATVWMNGRHRSEMLENMSDKLYEQFLVAKRPYCGIKADIFPSGCLCGLFQPGALEDYLHALANEHHFLAMIFVDRLNPFSKTERAVAFLIMHSFIFMLTSIATNAGGEVYWLISLLVIAPSRIIVDKFLYFLFGMPCLVNCCTCCRCCMEVIGRTIGAIFFACAFVFLYLGAIFITLSFSEGPQQQMIIWNYLYSVFVTSSFQEACLILLHFVNKDRCCCSCLNCLSCGMLGIGAWAVDKEKRLKEIEAGNPVADVEDGKGNAPRLNQVMPLQGAESDNQLSVPVTAQPSPAGVTYASNTAAVNGRVMVVGTEGAAVTYASQPQQQQPIMLVQGTLVGQQQPQAQQPQQLYMAQPQQQQPVMYMQQQQPPQGYYMPQQQQQPLMMMQGPGGVQYMAVAQQQPQPMMVMMTPM